jgi:hypothetical protein
MSAAPADAPKFEDPKLVGSILNYLTQFFIDCMNLDSATAKRIPS